MSGTIRPIRPTTVTEAVQAFEAHLRFKRKAERTIIQYGPVLRAFAAWAGDRPPASVMTFEIQSFLEDWLAKFLERNARAPSDHAMKGVVVALRSFYRYLHAYGLLLADGQHVPNPMLAIELPVIEQKQNDWLRQAEDEALLAAYTAT